MQKRGLSDMITTVLIILIVLVAVVIVWNFVSIFLKDSGTRITQTSVDVGKTPITIASGTEYYFVNGILSFVLVGGDVVSGVNQTGVRVGVENQEGVVGTFDVNISINSGETKRIYLNLSAKGLKNPKTLEISPIYTFPTGKRAASTNIYVYNLPAEKQIAYHSADYNRDYKIDDNELTRFIELYNYRIAVEGGTIRTGEYHCDYSTVDKYSPGPGDRSCNFHSADYNFDWEIDSTPAELLITVSLKNSAKGYRIATTQTIDGFEPVL